VVAKCGDVMAKWVNLLAHGGDVVAQSRMW
jgi:hypothetical protein